METLQHPPRTLMEVYEMLPEGTLAELIDNQIYMSPAPLFNHQIMVQTIFKELDRFLTSKKSGIVVLAPFDIKFDMAKNSVQPDITVILSENPSQVDREGRFQGSPDLIVEVLSRSNRDHDLIKKKDLYEKFGVKEYWIVDPDTRLVMGFTLSENRYLKISEEIGKIHSPLLNTSFHF
ncbi:MAG: Uma2 family endonuclease [Cyclobacteriaceae bacterium]|nr:Uma2 family endonuclease [Cyclobacteriaceae bacterium]